jgi:hypothetical protein
MRAAGRREGVTAAPPLPSRRRQAGEPQRAVAGGQPLGHPAALRAAGPRARRHGAPSPPHSCPSAADGAATRQPGVAARVTAGAACKRGAERQRGGDASAPVARRRRQAGGWAGRQAWAQTSGGRRPGGQVGHSPSARAWPASWRAAHHKSRCVRRIINCDGAPAWPCRPAERIILRRAARRRVAGGQEAGGGGRGGGASFESWEQQRRRPSGPGGAARAQRGLQGGGDRPQRGFGSGSRKLPHTY